MKILKYIFLLVLLLSTGGFILIATQKDEFKTTRSKVINSPKSSVYNYISNYKNLDNWYALEKNKISNQLKNSNKTSGLGSTYYFTGNYGTVKTTTIFTNETDSIAQKIDFNGSLSMSTWSLKDTIGGTKITFNSEGKLPFMYKIYAFLNGGNEKVMGDKLEKSLINLNRVLDYELNTFSIKPNGIVVKKGSYYLYQTINCKISKLNYNLNIIISKLTTFSKENNLEISGSPFVLYNLYEFTKGITNVSVCIPIRNRIFTSSGSDISGMELQAFKAFKTTLTGDYSHREKAWEQTSNYIKKSKQTPNKSVPLMELFIKGPSEEKRPSKWKTAIYIAIQSKYITKEPAKLSVNPNTETSEIAP